MTFRIGVVGLGWSGSGALIDLLKNKANSSGYPIEYDLFRKPKGLLECNSLKDIRKFCLRQICDAINRFFKALIKLVISFKKTNFLTSISLSASDILCASTILILSIVIHDSDILINKYVNSTIRLYRRRASVFYFDQPLFPEQISQRSIKYLSLNALIIVTRDVRDQVVEWYENGSYLSAKTIREQFFVGGKVGNINTISNSQIMTMLHTLEHRIKYLENLEVDPHLDIHYIRFEDLILNSQETIDSLNSYFISRGASGNLIDSNDVDDFFCESKKNIHKYMETKNNDSSLSETIMKANDRLNILGRKER
jgi:hypothetical protein